MKEAHELIVGVKGYLEGNRPPPTTEEVRAILEKLAVVADARAQVRTHREATTLTMKLTKCGPPCQAYVAHTDREHSQSLPW